MAEETTITLAELEGAVVKLLAAARAKHGDELDLDADHYWTVMPSAAFALSREPELVAGQLSDDVAEVRAFLARGDDEIHLWHDLAHLVGILNRIASLDTP